MPKASGAVVHISDCYAPRTGGIETQVGSLVEAQRRTGLAVEVITATQGPREDGIHRVTAPVPFDLPIHPRTRHRVTKLLEEINPSVVHIHLGATSPFAWGAMRACRDLGLPTVVTVHSMWGPASRTGYSTFMSKRLTASIQWSAVSERAAQLVSQAIRQPVSVLPNGIDPDFWVVNQSMSDHLRLISVLRMAPRKRVLSLLKAFRRAQVAEPTIQLTLIGDGPLLGQAKKFSERHALNVHFTGRQDRGQIRAALGNSDVFVQASIHESFGIAALEARSVGLAIIARVESGTQSFVDNGLGGYLVASDVEFADRIIELARNKEELRAMKAYNFSNRPPYDWDSIVIQAQNLYRRAQDAH